MFRAIVSNARRSLSASNQIPGPDPPSQESVIFVLKQLQKSPQKALTFLNYSKTNHQFKPSSTVYNLMLRILGRNPDRFAKDFWELANQMREEGHGLDHATYSTLLPSFSASALSNFHSRGGAQSAVDVIKSSSEALTESTVVAVLNEAKDRPSIALGFFRWAADRPGYTHGSSAYNAMAKILAKEEKLGKFWDFVAEMKESGFELDFDAYIKINRGFQKGKLLGDAVRLYEMMMDGNCKPGLQDCGLLLRRIAMADPPQLDLVSRVVRKFEFYGNSLSKSVYDGIHRSFTSAGRFQEADEIMEKMKGSGFDPDNITYSQLVYGLCKAGKMEEARAVVDEMESGGSVVPDLMTWTVLIKAHLEAGSEIELDRAVSLFADMIGRGHKPDGHIVDAMVRGLCRHGRVSAAYSLLLEMDKVGMLPWQATFKLLMENCLENNLLEEALKLLKRMRELKYPPYGDLIAAYISKVGTMEDALEFFKSMSGKASASSSVHLKIFRGLFKEGRYGEARDLLFRCPHHVRKDKDVAKLFGSAEISCTSNNLSS